MDDPELSDLYTIGTIAAVRQVLRLPGDNIRVMVEGIGRCPLPSSLLAGLNPFSSWQVEQIPPAEKTDEIPSVTEAVIRITYDLIQRYCELSPKTSSDVLLTVVDSEDPGLYGGLYGPESCHPSRGQAGHSGGTASGAPAGTAMNRTLRREIQVLEIERDLETKVQEQVSQNQKDYFLREQLKAIQS